MNFSLPMRSDMSMVFGRRSMDKELKETRRFKISEKVLMILKRFNKKEAALTLEE
jgi:hypothetical protein